MTTVAHNAVRAIQRDHTRDFSAIVGARPDRCGGCDWEGTDHQDHLADLIVAALLPGSGPLEALDDEDLLTLLPLAQAATVTADTNVHWVATALRRRRVSYARIGAALGVTRQAAWERFSQ